ncbi:uncharacterized protein KGF55_003602 [Candida pseudojiufengensis]|uniref:uncharacterized protein n=1 Tax=Candida pseudojiufengensis TaxID=497109 RepID=UPI0022257795|nr:uncharacterized protein KGF55_003602 [Candida pseudojiufengensis]KAI5962526.1 hypothetical protein KGF55_003602 [Candida pseudojiufengensis]
MISQNFQGLRSRILLHQPKSRSYQIIIPNSILTKFQLKEGLHTQCISKVKSSNVKFAPLINLSRKFSNINKNTSEPTIQISNNNKSQSQREIEKSKYDDLIKSAISTHLSNGNNSTLTRKSRVTFKTFVIFLISIYVISILIYAAIQLRNYQIIEINDRDGMKKIKKRSLFVPLWFNLNTFGHKTLKYPQELKYLDEDLYHFVMNDIIQQQQKQKMLPTNKEELNLQEFLKDLQLKNINYSLLLKVSLNSKIREFFGLPVTLDFPTSSDFNIWIELNHPSVNGIEFEFSDDLNELNGFFPKTKVKFQKSIKTINLLSIKNKAFSYWDKSLNLENLESNSVDIADSIHEIHDNKIKPTRNNDDYEIKFSGECDISNKSISYKNDHDHVKGKLKYVGSIDPDYLILNNGVQITKVELNYDDTWYKIV